LRTALFPGSFDPFHNGHMEIVEAASKLFDRLYVAPMRNTQKNAGLFSLDERMEMIKESVVHLPNVSLASFSSLVVDLAREIGADVIIKGLRVASDAEAELTQAQMNKKVSGIETLLHPCSSEYSFLASKYVRDFAKFGAVDRIGSTVPPPVLERLKQKFGLMEEGSS
jgi:pantetheine-phosphate adenylyltransferase